MSIQLDYLKNYAYAALFVLFFEIFYLLYWS